MKRIKYLLASLLAPLSLGLAVLVPVANVGAVDAFQACSTSGSTSNPVCSSKSDTVTNYVQIIVNILLFVIGIVAVIMIIVGGIRYTTSAGDEKAVRAAKDTILYAVVGLVVAALAFAIVNWVLSFFIKS